MGNCPACFTSESVHHSNEEEDDSIKVVRTTDGELFHYTSPVYVKDLMVYFKGYVVLQNLKYPHTQLHPETQLKFSHVYYLMPGNKLSIKESDLHLHQLVTSVYPLVSSNENKNNFISNQQCPKSEIGKCNSASHGLVTSDKNNESKLNPAIDSLSKADVIISFPLSNTDDSTTESNSIIALGASHQDLSNSQSDSNKQFQTELSASTDRSASSQSTFESNHIDTSESICLAVTSYDQFIDFNLTHNDLSKSNLATKSLETIAWNPGNRLASTIVIDDSKFSPTSNCYDNSNLVSNSASHKFHRHRSSNLNSPASNDADKFPSSSLVAMDKSASSSDNLKANNKQSQASPILRKSSNKDSIKTQKKVRFADEVAFISSSRGEIPSSTKDTKASKAQAENGVTRLKVVISKKQLTELMSPRAADQKQAMEKVIAPLISPQQPRSETMVKDCILSCSKMETSVAA